MVGGTGAPDVDLVLCIFINRLKHEHEFLKTHRDLRHYNELLSVKSEHGEQLTLATRRRTCSVCPSSGIMCLYPVRNTD